MVNLQRDLTRSLLQNLHKMETTTSTHHFAYFLRNMAKRGGEEIFYQI